MSKKLYIDATHPNEVRVVLKNGDHIEDYEYESVNNTLIKNNIYLGKVSRIEPSLQAAFIDYGAERKGFLSFDMIHPKNYKIPVACQDKVIKQLQNKSKDNNKGNSDAEESKQEKTYKIPDFSKKYRKLIPKFFFILKNFIF